ncbi:MAG: uracil-DNA glycosylase [Acidobacteriota bacterium]|nr:uracil-DNA glycosylase [Acidobacteriota bacterium]
MSETEYGSDSGRAASGPARGARRAEMVQLAQEISQCRRCPRLVAWREQVARERRAAFRDEHYWGRPLPGFGDPAARVLLLGLAPAAHGANRTGRMFTGDRSGEFLFAALWRTGFANRPESISLEDGLRLSGAFVTAAVRCAPPANRPTPEERELCRPWTVRELSLLSGVRVVVCLGAFAWDAALRLRDAPGRRPRFAHGAELPARADEPPEAIAGAAGVGRAGELAMLGCFHPSQQNTFTGRLTEPMIDDVLLRARTIAGLGPSAGRGRPSR